MTGGEIQFIAYCNTVPPQCAIPTGLTASASGFDITVSWDIDSSVQSYTLEYDTAGFTPGTGTSINVIGDSTTISGLTAATTYEFYLVANCSATDSSDPTPIAASATTAACPASNACEYEFVLVDTYGDGWDGWEITVADSAGNVYAVLGDGSAEKGYTLRLYHKPLVSWIWFGAVMMALGGLVALYRRPQLARKAE